MPDYILYENRGGTYTVGMSHSLPWHLLGPIPGALVPLLYALAALSARPRAPFLAGRIAGAVAFWWSLALLFGVVGAPAFASRLPDLVTCVELCLVSGVGFVVIANSQRALGGESNQASFARALLATLTCVTTLIAARNLGLVAVAWTATSFALHRLLTFYGARRPAVVAAHKKFVQSRLADGCLALALTIVVHQLGTLDVARVNAAPPSGPLAVAAVLVVFAVVLKTAQVPFHGWLTQVMEAPTPVSALLHAGVVNLGAMVLLKIAPWIDQVMTARVLLVGVGSCTAVLAGLVAGTRVSIKASLAWSTSAQLGFMLVECGLGAWHMALIHLVAHSAYKAHAFMSAGGAVQHFRERQGRARGAAPTLVAALVTAAALVLGFAASRALSFTWLVFVLSAAPLLSHRASVWGRAAVALRLGGMALLLWLWSRLAVSVIPPSSAPLLLPVAAGLVFVAGFVVHVQLTASPDGWLSRVLRPALFAGFYLDQALTAAMFRIWPPVDRRPSVPAVVLGVPSGATP